MAHLLAAHVGAWTGTGDFRLLATDDAVGFEATAAVAVVVGGRVSTLHYTWRHPDDGPQDGLLVLGPLTDGAESPTALWGDSWHQAPSPRILEIVSHGRGVVELGYQYADDGWRWHLLLDCTDERRLLLRMDNVAPPGSSEPRYDATTLELTRPG